MVQPSVKNGPVKQQHKLTQDRSAIRHTELWMFNVFYKSSNYKHRELMVLSMFLVFSMLQFMQASILLDQMTDLTM